MKKLESLRDFNFGSFWNELSQTTYYVCLLFLAGKVHLPTARTLGKAEVLPQTIERAFLRGRKLVGDVASPLQVLLVKTIDRARVLFDCWFPIHKVRRLTGVARDEVRRRFFRLVPVPL